MKVAVIFATLITTVTSQETFATQDTAADALYFPSQGKTIKSIDQLMDTGIMMESLDKGGMEALEQALAEGELEFALYEEATLNPELLVIDLGSNQTAIKAAQQDIDVVEDGNVRRLQRRRCPEAPGSGISNNVVLTVTLRFLGFVFRFRFSCGEQCCARMWECTHGRCKLLCQNNRVLEIRTFSPFICCRLDGRETVIPIGPCFNGLLCSA